jgi:hypothetical protein
MKSQPCACICHRNWNAPEPVPAGPRSPLEEKDAEIERLRREVASHRLTEHLTAARIFAEQAYNCVDRALYVYNEKALFVRLSVAEEHARVLHEEIETLLNEVKGEKQGE